MIVKNLKSNTVRWIQTSFSQNSVCSVAREFLGAVLHQSLSVMTLLGQTLAPSVNQSGRTLCLCWPQSAETQTVIIEELEQMN